MEQQEKQEKEQQQEKKGLRGWMDKIITVANMEVFPSRKEAEPKEEGGEAAPALNPFGVVDAYKKLRDGLQKTKEGLVGRIDALVLGKKEIDAETLEELEEILITSDIGVKTTVELVRTLEQRLGRNELKDGEALRAALKEEILQRLTAHHARLDISSRTPFVLLVIGVNGVGKTTTIGKLAARFTGEGRRVLLAAADTFRAAAAEQLTMWGERCGVDVVRHKEGADPSAVVFDACKAAVARGVDLLIIDTAGRLHTKVNLMEEMKKIRRVIEREIPGAPHETLLVVDAATGQNAVSQARLFKEAAGVTGLALTKLDGTAKGGIVVAVSHEFALPVRYIGVGETVEDLRDFDPQEFTDALFQA
ncbi:signal recognition particle receptor FtsY [Geobacter sp. SVR]|nr:signal recognition particle receptor FtsY [Geobacter sp. SVR]GCF84808.1 signal recognition particle receptor FtsY [Geobacter sp. SVR]